MIRFLLNLRPKATATKQAIFTKSNQTNQTENGQNNKYQTNNNESFNSQSSSSQINVSQTNNNETYDTQTGNIKPVNNSLNKTSLRHKVRTSRVKEKMYFILIL